MTGVSKVVSRGGVALSVVGLGIACHEIAATESRDKQNEILVESGGSLIGGALYSVVAGIGLAVMATPVGWTGALIIGTGGALAGYAGGQTAKRLYDLRGRHIDLVDNLGISNTCAGNSRAQTSATRQTLSGFATFQR